MVSIVYPTLKSFFEDCLEITCTEIKKTEGIPKIKEIVEDCLKQQFARQ